MGCLLEVLHEVWQFEGEAKEAHLQDVQIRGQPWNLAIPSERMMGFFFFFKDEAWRRQFVISAGIMLPFSCRFHIPKVQAKERHLTTRQ